MGRFTDNERQKTKPLATVTIRNKAPPPPPHLKNKERTVTNKTELRISKWLRNEALIRACVINFVPLVWETSTILSPLSISAHARLRAASRDFSICAMLRCVKRRLQRWEGPP